MDIRVAEFFQHAESDGFFIDNIWPRVNSDIYITIDVTGSEDAGAFYVSKVFGKTHNILLFFMMSFTKSGYSNLKQVFYKRFNMKSAYSLDYSFRAVKPAVWILDFFALNQFSRRHIARCFWRKLIFST